MSALSAKTRRALLVLLLIAANFAVDRLTKILAVLYLKGAAPIVFFHRLIVVKYAENTGAFLSLGNDWGLVIKYAVFVIIPVIVCIAGTLYLALREKRLYRLIALSCAIGGGAGNIFDRVTNDFKVVDFINFGIGGLRTGILNAADLSVTFGLAVMLLLEYTGGRGGGRSAGNAPAGDPPPKA